MIDSSKISLSEATNAIDAWSNQPTIRFIPDEMQLEDLVQAYNLSDTAGILFCGGVTILVIFILLLLIKNREKIYFHYALFLLFMLFYGIINIKTSSVFGIPTAHFLSFNKRLIEPVTIFSFAFYIFFSLDLIDIKQQSQRLYKSLSLFGYACLAYASLYYAFFNFFIPIEHAIFLGARAIIFPLCLFFLLHIQFKLTSPLKSYFIMGSTAYFLGSIIATIRYTVEDIPWPAFYKLTSPIYFEMGIMIEILCFALALGQRIYFLYQEKEETSRQLIHQLSINEQITKQMNTRLEVEVKERTQEIIATQFKLQDQEKKRIHAEFEKKLAQSEMLARRLQINPHFIFNCLNAIKYLIQSEQNEEASRDLVIFSKFIRMVLDSSQKHVISISEEMEIIMQYLKLEKKRFDNDFTFEIVGADHFRLNDIFIPPLLLQPFAENAIWHGLLNSAHKIKVIKIEISVHDQHLAIIIDDNGIGRKEANKLSVKKLYKSMGIALSKERIKLYNHDHQNTLSLSIIDKANYDGLSLGTRVEMIIQLNALESFTNR